METFEGTFNCNGKVNLNDWHLKESNFFMRKDIDVVLNNKKPHCPNALKIFNFDTTGINILSNLQEFSKILDTRLKLIGRHEKLKSFQEKFDVNETTNFYLLRKSASEFVYHLRNYVINLKAEDFALKDVSDTAETDFNDLLSTIIKFLNRLKNIPASTFLYVSSPLGNKSNQPDYHMYHIHLDLRWLLVTLTYVKNYQCEDTKEASEELRNCIHNVVKDLIYISMQIFESTPRPELRTKSPYSCTCMRELWLMLQILADELNNRRSLPSFWDFVNSFLSESIEHVPNNKKYRHLSKCKNPELFSTWLIYHLTLLYGYDANGIYSTSPSNRYQELQQISSSSHIEKNLKAYSGKAVNDRGGRDELDQEVGILIHWLHILALDWWKPDFQIYASLFDYFHKRFNTPYLMQIRGPWITSSEKQTPMDLLNNIRDRLKNDTEISEESSFGSYLRLMGLFLKKYCNRESKTWLKLRGRIFSKFSKDKIEKYSECELYNFISLCLTLVVAVDISFTAAMFSVFPTDMDWKDSASAKFYSLLFKTVLAVLLLHHERKLSYKEVGQFFVKAADIICCCRDEYARSMMLWGIDVLRLILSINTNFEKDEHELIGAWIDRYLNEIPPNRHAVLMNLLLKVWQKCVSPENRHVIGNSSMRIAIWTHVISRLRLMLNVDDDTKTNFYELPVTLAANFTIEACFEPFRFQSSSHAPAKLVLHFTTSPILKDFRVAKLYISLILQSENTVEFLKREKDFKDFDLFCVKLWVKCSIFTTEENDQNHAFKNYVANVLATREIIIDNVDYNEFLNSNEPFTSFLIMVAKKRNTITSEREKIIFDTTCRSFLFGMDKWVLFIINDENKDSKESNHAYQCIGLIFNHWSQILYSKDSSNMLKALIMKLVVPENDTLSYRIYLSQKIFSMVILGFENLNVAADVSLQNLLRELFVKFLPLLVTQADNVGRTFKIEDTLLKCFFAKPDFTKSIFSILGRNIITMPQEQTTHACCYLVMILLTKLIKAGKSYCIEVVNSIVNECANSIINCYCLVHDSHPHKRHTLDFLREITASDYYKENSQIREKLKTAIWNALAKHTKMHPTASFDLVNFTLKIDIELFKNLRTHMEAFVSVCEKQNYPNAKTMRFQLNSMKRI